MWLFTVDGMYSVVLASSDQRQEDSPADSGRVEVQARRRDHLERLCRRYDIPEEICKVEGTSCPYRITVSKRCLLHVMSLMTSDINYVRFMEAAKESRSRHAKRSGYIRLLDDIAQLATNRLRPPSR